MSMTNPYMAGINSLLAGEAGAAGVAGNPLLRGLSGLPGAAGGVLTRGLGGTGAAQYASRAGQAIPFGQTLASQVPMGAGANALASANALRGGGQAASGLLGRLPNIPSPSAARGLFANPNLGKAASMKGLGYGLAGAAGSGLVDKLNLGGDQSTLEDTLKGAAQGAGIGAGIGSVFPGIGTGIGALGGAVAGGAIEVLGGLFGGGSDDSDVPEPVAILGNAIAKAGLPPEMTEEILTTYEVMMALAEAEEDDAARAALQQQAYQQAGAMVLQAMQQKDAARSSASNMMGLQAQAADIFDPLARDIETSGMLYADAMRGIRDDLPESYRAIADATTARELSSSQKLASAYKAQAAITPVVNQLAQYQQDYNSFAAQQFAQALAQQAAGQQMGGMGGGQTADIAALLAPQ